MPGVSIARRRGGLPREVVSEALDAVCFFDDYGVERLVDGTTLTNGTDVAVAATGYESYPVTRVETDEAIVVLEGHLYDVDDDELEAHLEDVAAWARRGAVGELSAWVGGRDGDFLVFVVGKDTGDLAVVTDAFGRLPLYCATVDGITVLSRELKFVREVARRVDDPVSIDEMGVAQTLLFGYRLGTRTLFSGVERVPPGSLLSLGHDGRGGHGIGGGRGGDGRGGDGRGGDGRGGDETEIVRIHQFCFGPKPHAGRSREENAEVLATLFEEACRNRADLHDDTVVALSGGLDSRAVAAGFDSIDASFTAATFDRADGSAADEVRAAREVAEALDVEWREYVVSGSEERRETLLSTKQGMNDLRLSFLLDFLGQIDAERGATYVTGDGGDKAFPVLSPPRSFDDVSDLVRYVVSANRIFSPSEAADVAGVTVEALLSTVRERVESYPESDLRARYVHFLIRERGMNWLSHGEDRNRYYYWSVSPFYSLPFFRYAMGCPDGQKRGNELYRRFLSELSPDVLSVEYVNFGAPITSMEYRAKQFVYDALSRHPELRTHAVGLVKRVKRDRTVSAPEVARAIGDQLTRSRSVNRALSPHGIDRIVREPGSYTEPAMYHLYTVTSVVDRCPEVAE